MKSVLILTAGFGEGHNAAARNVRDALELAGPDVQVRVVDLFEATYTRLNSLARRAHLGVVRYAPRVWAGIYSWLDSSSFLDRRLGGSARLREALGHVLHETRPDCVVSTYPAYAHILRELYRDHAERPFRFLTIITDSISVNSAWYRAESDLYVVANEPTAAVLRDAGVPDERIRPLGFPVSAQFEEEPAVPPPEPVGDEPWRVIYVINSGKRKTGRALEKLLRLPQLRLTVTAGKDAVLKAILQERFREFGDRVRIHGWTNQMPQLLLSHHLVIGKAGGAIVQEAIAARCPMIINQIIPGQEEGNARLIESQDLGQVIGRNRELPEAVEAAFTNDAARWRRWRENLSAVRPSAAARRIAELILAESDWRQPAGAPGREIAFPGAAAAPVRRPVTPGTARMLLCDFHIHSNYSDGKLPLPEVVDFYGSRGFDVICLTDHLADPRRMYGKLANLSRLVVAPSQLGEYFEVLARERRRAWRKYNLIVLTGIEFNKDGLTKKSSAHLLGLDLKEPINPALDLPETIAQIHAQAGLAVASHPHVYKTEWGKNTLHLWEHLDTFVPLIDAWEIANRNEIFTPVGLRRLPYLANSDFHKPRHIYSWKTLLHCEKEPEAVKDCIRRNEHVSITLYREGCLRQAAGLRTLEEDLADRIIPLQTRLPLAVAR